MAESGASVHAEGMIERFNSASPSVLAAAPAIMVAMTGALLLRGALVSVVSGLTVGCAVLIDASADLPGSES